MTSKDYVAASKEFEEMMLGKVDTALEQEKINLAGQIFNNQEPSEEDEDEYDEEDHIENDAEDESDEETEEESEESEEDEWDEEESNKRMDVIGQNGNDGLHYDEENEE